MNSLNFGVALIIYGIVFIIAAPWTFRFITIPVLTAVSRWPKEDIVRYGPPNIFAYRIAGILIILLGIHTTPSNNMMLIFLVLFLITFGLICLLLPEQILRLTVDPYSPPNIPSLSQRILIKWMLRFSGLALIGVGVYIWIKG